MHRFTFIYKIAVIESTGINTELILEGISLRIKPDAIENRTITKKVSSCKYHIKKVPFLQTFERGNTHIKISMRAPKA